MLRNLRTVTKDIPVTSQAVMGMGHHWTKGAADRVFGGDAGDGEGGE